MRMTYTFLYYGLFKCLINKTAGERSELFDAAVAQERPPAAHVFRAFQINFHHHVFFRVTTGTCQHLALRTGHETAAPELYATGLSGRVRLMSHTVHRDDRQAVGNGMPPLHRGPCLALAFLLFRIRWP